MLSEVGACRHSSHTFASMWQTALLCLLKKSGKTKANKLCNTYSWWSFMFMSERNIKHHRHLPFSEVCLSGKVLTLHNKSCQKAGVPSSSRVTLGSDGALSAQTLSASQSWEASKALARIQNAKSPPWKELGAEGRAVVQEGRNILSWD